MLQSKVVPIACVCMLGIAGPAAATSYVLLDLHQSVESSDVIVIARVSDSVRALVTVERVLKGKPPTQITLVDYVDRFAGEADRKPLLNGVRELLFLKHRQGDSYAPLQEQAGRWAIHGESLNISVGAAPGRLADTVASIARLVTLQTRAARGGTEADQAFVTAFADVDREVQKWAATAHGPIKVPSRALVSAVLAHWSKDPGAVANAVMRWRLREAGPLLAKTLTGSGDGVERSLAAMALGGTGDRTYLPLLRRVASSDSDAQVRALAYRGIVWMLGAESLDDLRLGAKDPHETVRSQVVVDAYNMLELGWAETLWPRPSEARIKEVRGFIAVLLQDPSARVSQNARSMLAMIAKHQP